MAGDWIKIEGTLPDKPEVIRISIETGLDQDAVVGKLIRIWIWADQQSADGTDLPLTSSFLDRLTAFPGFAAAMRKVGWLGGREGSLSFPRFDRHNGQTAKLRAENNRRAAKSRALKILTDKEVVKLGHENVAQNALQNTLPKALPEKRREECITSDEVIHPPTPPGGEHECGESSKPKGRKKRKPLSRSTGLTSEAIAGIEVDGQLVMYDADPLVWEAAFIRWWNGRPGVIKRELLSLDTPMRSELVSRLSEGDWFWKRVEGHFPLWTPSDWKPTLGWFLEPASVSKILDGKYEPRTNTPGLFGSGPRDEPGRIRTGATSNAIEQAFAEAAAAGH